MLAFFLFYSLVITVFASPRVFSRVQKNSTIAAAWYTPWHPVDFPLSQVSWSKYTHLIYAFATTSPNTIELTDSDEDLLPRFVASAHQHNVVAMLSIGGWAGSRWFSTLVGTPANRTNFVRVLTNIVKQYNVDGLEFDWEYPGLKGIGNNEINANDTKNYLDFLWELRNSTTGQNLVLSAVSWDIPWIDSTGSPLRNLSGFSEVLDFISIMNYDISSNSSIGAGSSSPLDDSCAPIGARFGSVMSAVAAWTLAGIPVNKLVLGVPSYGHSFVTNSSQSGGSGQVDAPVYPLYSNITHQGDRWDTAGGTDDNGNPVGYGGTFQYWGLIEEGFLNSDGTPKKGIKYRFDNCSKTPFVFNSTAQLFISYEDPLSFAYKGNYIRSAGLKGFAIWEAGGDYKDALLNSILNATQNGGFPPAPSASLTDSNSETPHFRLQVIVLTGFFLWLLLSGSLVLRDW